jgi:hypothetical protein
VKPLSFKRNFDQIRDNVLQLFNCHVGQGEFMKVSVNL